MMAAVSGNFDITEILLEHKAGNKIGIFNKNSEIYFFN